MTFNELRKIYTSSELSSLPGDAKLRKEAFSPILSDLYENKVIYQERFCCVVSLSEIELTTKGFQARCIPFAKMAPIGTYCWEPPEEGWLMGGAWSTMRLSGNSINALYAGWTIWPEKDRVREVCKILTTGDYEKAHVLTFD